MAAPVGGQIFSEILPYLEINKENVENEDNIEDSEEVKHVEVPDIIGKNISEAEKVLKENDLQLKIKNEEVINNEELCIKNQVPQAGTVINAKSSIMVEM